jgi:hypothetical protein
LKNPISQEKINYKVIKKQYSTGIKQKTQSKARKNTTQNKM